jgi:protein O-GlcNAc transferase
LIAGRALGDVSPEARAALARALALADEGRPDDAAQALADAEARHPGDPTLPLVAGHFHRQKRQPGPALAAARRAIALAPDNADACCLLGLCLVDAGDAPRAEVALKRATVLAPDHALAHDTLGTLASLDLRYDEAEAHWIAAIEAVPEDTAPLRNLAQMLQQTARGDEAVALLAPAAAALPEDIGLQWTMAVAANYAPHLTAEAVAEHHRQHGRAVLARLPREALQPLPATWRAGPMRVGFLSPDFREHSVAWFLLPLLRYLDRTRVEVFAYMTSRRIDAVTERFRAVVPGLVECGAMTDLDLLRRVRADRLDILVECAGLFDGGRPAALALRMAPTQVTWLGYPNTTGLPNMDVRLVDAITDPAGADALATERLVRIEAPFLCWQAGTAVPLPVRDASRPVTFGCFNVLSKLHDDLLAVWARVLAAVPGSRLLLKAGALGSDDIAALLREKFEDLGIDPARIETRGFMTSRDAHLAAYGEVDIALDPFPYNGTTTTCEALWMGTPVVTLAGRGHPARVGVSLLTALGQEAWIAATTDEYVDLAVRLASDRTALAGHHRTLRERMKRSPLYDAADFARRFVSALERS